MSKYRIMIIDDDDDARKLIGLMLRPRYEVVEACDGLDALSKLEVYEPDFAIIDIMMPLMDGYQVCEAIRRHPRFRAMQVLFLSAYGSTENIKKSYAVGANLFMTKPVDPERILKNIDFTIEHTPPMLQPKRYSLEQLAAMDAEHARARAETNRPVATPPPPREDRLSRDWNPRDDAFGERRPEPAPPRATAPGPPPATGYGPPAEGAKPRVLMVDDDPELLQMLDLALREDYEITTASNGIEAVEKMVDYQPDLMLIDVMMPKMNGFQLLQSIRRNSYFGKMPILVLTAKSSPKDKDYATRLGANAFLSKPFHIEELLGTLRTMTAIPGFRVRPKKMSIFEIKSRNVAR